MPTLKKFIIERDVPGIGSKNDKELCGASKQSNDALRQLSPHVQWAYSYVAGNKTFCVYYAEDESYIKKHAELSGFPANIITEVVNVIDPTWEKGA